MANGNIKPTVDACAAMAAAISWSDYLPKIAAGMAVIWYLIRFVEWVKDRYGSQRSGE